MAIPGAFTPVEWEGRVLSDGGLVNNLPTDVVKAMGAEVIIGVTLGEIPARLHSSPFWTMKPPTPSEPSSSRKPS